jgi:hypothetical protein
MRTRIPGLLAAALVLSAVLQASWLASLAEAQTETQTFDTAAAATAAGWTGFRNTINNNNYGFSNTNNTGGLSPAGEAGGIMARSAAISYYADTTLGTTFTRGTAFSASGEFDFFSVGNNFDGGVQLGHIDPTDTTDTVGNSGQDVVGIQLLEDAGLNPNQMRVRAMIRFSDGNEQFGNIFTIVGANTDRLWSYTFNPAGNGSLSVSMDGPGGGVSTLNLVADGRNFALTAFGLSTQDFGGLDGRVVPLFIDNVTFSSLGAVPEPASALIWSIVGGAGLVLARRRRRLVR